MSIVLSLIIASVLFALAPLLSGLIRKAKNTARLRAGAGVLQPYYNLAKLFGKEEVVSETASWIFRAAPSVVLASSAAALLIVPAAGFGWARGTGDLFALVFILSLGRFFLALAGLDAGSSFGGMGSSREMFLSSFAEPAAVLAFFAAGLVRGTSAIAPVGGMPSVSLAAAAAALFCVMLAETSRVPVDNQETHLELTMIHEAMTLEYSGRSLALIELAAHARQVLWYALIISALVPAATAAAGIDARLLGGGISVLLAAFIACAVALIEVSVAKMRLFRVVDFLVFASLLSGMAVVAAVLGY